MRSRGFSDAAFVVLPPAGLGVVAALPVSTPLRDVALGVLASTTVGVIAYALLKYLVRTPEPPADEVSGGLGYALIASLWAGVAMSILGGLVAGRPGEIVGAAVSGLAGLAIACNVQNALFAIAGHDHAVGLILKPAWLLPRHISQPERLALARATGIAWSAGALLDIAIAITR